MGPTVSESVAACPCHEGKSCNTGLSPARRDSHSQSAQERLTGAMITVDVVALNIFTTRHGGWMTVRYIERPKNANDNTYSEEYSYGQYSAETEAREPIKQCSIQRARQTQRVAFRFRKCHFERASSEGECVRKVARRRRNFRSDVCIALAFLGS